MNFYGAPAVDRGSVYGQHGYPSSGYQPSQPGLMQGFTPGQSLTQARYPSSAAALGQQFAGNPMTTAAPAIQGYTTISGYPAGMAYPSSNMTSTAGQFRSSQAVPHPSLQTMPSTTLAYAATPQYPSMNPTYLNSAHHLHQSSNYPPPGNPVMTMPSALTHQGAYATGAPLTSVPRGYSVGAPNAIPAGLQSSIPGGVSQVGYPAGYSVQGPYTSANLYGGGQYPGL